MLSPAYGKGEPSGSAYNCKGSAGNLNDNGREPQGPYENSVLDTLTIALGGYKQRTQLSYARILIHRNWDDNTFCLSH